MQELRQLDRGKLATVIRRQDVKKWWVAESLGIHKTTLRRWQSGRIRKVRAEHVLRLAELLCVPESQLVRAENLSYP